MAETRALGHVYVGLGVVIIICVIDSVDGG